MAKAFRFHWAWLLAAFLAPVSLGCSFDTSARLTSDGGADAAPAVWELQGPATVDEGSTASYTVVLSGVSLAEGESATVDVETLDAQTNGTTEDLDYISIDGTTLRVEGPNDRVSFTVESLTDQRLDGAEDYEVRISNTSLGTIATDLVTTTIVDRTEATQARWALSGDPTTGEGSNANYLISLSGIVLGADESATISIITVPAASTPALEGEDFTSLDGTTMTITGPATSASVSVATLADSVLEESELFEVQILNPSIGQVQAGQDIAQTSIEDTTGPQWSLSGDAAVTEGDSASYTVSVAGLVLADGATATAVVDTLDGTGIAATEGQDYVSVDGTTITLTGPATSANFTVQTVADNELEDTEQFQVQLSNPSIGELVIDEDLVETSIADETGGARWFLSGDTSVDEGNSASYTVALSGIVLLAGQQASISVDSLDGSATVATEGQDYVSVDGTTITITGPATSANFTVQTVADTILESAEQYQVQISIPSIGIVEAGQDTIETSIVDGTNSGNATWALSGDVSVNEGSQATYTVSLSGITLASGQAASIGVNSLDGAPISATEGQDYVSVDGTTITITGPATSADFVVQTSTDALVEGAENYRVRISNPSIGNITAGQNTVATVIVDAT